MELMIVDREPFSLETQKILEILGKDRVTVYSPTNILEDYQKNYKLLYALDPQDLIKFKVKIPYFYNVSGSYYTYNNFSSFYSQITGASGVFVSDKKLNKFSEWLNLNTLWVNPQIDITNYRYTYRKFLTPKLNIGFVQKGDTSDILKNMWYAKRSNWNLHILGNNKDILDAEYYSNESTFYENIHIFLEVNSISSPESLKAMSMGIALIAYNKGRYFDNILFDKVHYFEIDFLDSNTILEILRYSDKRREKLERLGKSGSYLIAKYFNSSDIVKQKLSYMKIY